MDGNRHTEKKEKKLQLNYSAESKKKTLMTANFSLLKGFKLLSLCKYNEYTILQFVKTKDGKSRQWKSWFASQSIKKSSVANYFKILWDIERQLIEAFHVLIKFLITLPMLRCITFFNTSYCDNSEPFCISSEIWLSLTMTIFLPWHQSSDQQTIWLADDSL